MLTICSNNWPFWIVAATLSTLQYLACLYYKYHQLLILPIENLKAHRLDNVQWTWPRAFMGGFFNISGNRTGADWYFDAASFSKSEEQNNLKRHGVA